jgi:hypothetical protein
MAVKKNLGLIRTLPRNLEAHPEQSGKMPNFRHLKEIQGVLPIEVEVVLRVSKRLN